VLHRSTQCNLLRGNSHHMYLIKQESRGGITGLFYCNNNRTFSLISKIESKD
jgi:hypothetical protein